jgi:hypothetical protein
MKKLTLLLCVLALAALGVAACGGDDDLALTVSTQGGASRTVTLGEKDPEQDTAQRRVVTTSFGTPIIRTVDDGTGLKLEAQGDNLYLEPTDATSDELRGELRGKPLGASCTTRDGRTVKTFPLMWRERSEDWGVALKAFDRWENEELEFAEAVASCEVRRGTPVGGGRTDVAAGPALLTGRFTE